MFIQETPYRAGWYIMRSTPAEVDILAAALPLYVYINEGDMSGDALPAEELQASEKLAELFTYKFSVSIFSSHDLINIYGALNLYLDAVDDFPEVCAAPDASARALCSRMIDDIQDIVLAVVE